MVAYVHKLYRYTLYDVFESIIYAPISNFNDYFRISRTDKFMFFFFHIFMKVFFVKYI